MQRIEKEARWDEEILAREHEGRRADIQIENEKTLQGPAQHSWLLLRFEGVNLKS